MTEWAAHRVHALLKVYAECLEGRDEAASHCIDEALKMPEARTDA